MVALHYSAHVALNILARTVMIALHTPTICSLPCHKSGKKTAAVVARTLP